MLHPDQIAKSVQYLISYEWNLTPFVSKVERRWNVKYKGVRSRMCQQQEITDLNYGMDIWMKTY